MIESVFSLLFMDRIDSEDVVKKKYVLGVLNNDIIIKPSKALTSLSMIYGPSLPSMHEHKTLKAGIILDFIIKLSNVVLNVSV